MTDELKQWEYDKGYTKGYSDGRASLIEELEKIKAKIDNLKKAHHIWLIDQDVLIDECSEIIDEHISELKGENE